MRKKERLENKCFNCKKSFLYLPSENRIAKYCSIKCRGFCRRFWSICTKEEALERLNNNFFKYVIVGKNAEDCWDWSGGLRGTGYGQVNYNKKQISAHRASWMIHKGDIPEKKLVCHTCDNRKCYNPEHLFLGSSHDNMQDMHLKGRTPIATLNPFEVLTIRSRLKNGEGAQNLADTYKVSKATIFDIKYRRSWKFI